MLEKLWVLSESWFSIVVFTKLGMSQKHVLSAGFRKQILKLSRKIVNKDKEAKTSIQVKDSIQMETRRTVTSPKNKKDLFSKI